jgi:thioredoxin reductase (NADPH)
MAELNLHPTAFPKIEAACPELDEGQIATLAKFAASRQFKAGETLIAAGEQELKLFVVKSGEVEVREHSSGEVVTVLGPRQFTGEVDLLAGRPSAVSVIAKTDCDTYEVSADVLKKIIREMPRLSDLLLRAFLMRRELIEELGLASVRVIGSRHSKETHRIREFLAKNKIPFSWIDLENDPQVDALLKNFKTEPNETPLVICGENRILRNPSNGELADCLGIRKPIEHTIYDLIIVGAGPAGLAAAVYGASEGLKTLLLDRMGPGGQAGSSSKIENYMGFPTGLSGSDLAERAVVQAEKFGATLTIPDEAIGLRNDGGYHEVMLDRNEKLAAKCVLISSGAAYRKLNVKNNDRFEGTGVYYAATRVEAPFCKQAQVVVVGGGNSAGQAAMFFSAHARSVTILCRGDTLEKSMSRYLIDQLANHSNIRTLYGVEVAAAHGDTSLEALEVRDRATAETTRLDSGGLFIFIGADAETAWLPPEIALNRLGYVLTGSDVRAAGRWGLERDPYLLETSVPGIFACGDVRCGPVKRVAAAVGEGSMAIAFVHQYLKEAESRH